ncbi:bifunctional biotin--[acetyl-CoA-carboxylase] ligase/biotin operon repressor BirA [Simiduia agarivorans]|uniref:Bifunctional ligase/repressor BirA n=1 Tax=Simiduia agarivorans (strain DSM 21679 / JCM 13881 / BCRC 17597 / SA1) TaxID=1117647 RepID=K4KYL7_SIMAS|nr:bifunctional biotin--[acetyl-CoA-carboxylase] ligase/biotin operon repressor BirA [Simiduia agarivorans]AFU99037.1 biotin-[acetyl-CoA-carboxylase] ligase [Simiduia agarivorans SA1 = DSM 21679]
MAETRALDALVLRLADGEFHSGEDLGQLLGVSRTAVWKQLQKLHEYGLAVESVKGKGYRLPAVLDLLDPAIITTQLSAPARSHLDIVHLYCTDSTNTRAVEASAQGIHGRVWLAEQQTAGRGRRGRAWVSPFAANLYLSMGWHFFGGAAALSGLSLAVGVACARALASLGLTGLQLKWPNDLLVNGKKLGGILLEMTGDPAGECRVVVGVGLNVAMPPATAIDQPWVDLASLGVKVTRNDLAAAVLSQMHAALEQFAREGFSAFRSEWMGLDAFAGVPVTLSSAATVHRGVARGVDASGALLLETDDGVQAMHGGELSLRAGHDR